MVNITLNIPPRFAWQNAKLWQDASRRAAILAAFWARVNRADAKACWLWRGGTNGRGYGLFGLPSLNGHKARVRAHRFAWLLSRGPIPAGFEVCHSCDVTLCVNPAHLFLGSHRDNHLDAVRKGRKSVFGVQKLNAEQVLAIRRLLAEGRLHRHIANQFGVARNTVTGIANRTTWAHLPEEPHAASVAESLTAVNG